MHQYYLVKSEKRAKTVILFYFYFHERKQFNFDFNLRGGSRNFEQPIFRNLKIASVKSYERSSYSIFLFTKLFVYFFSII